MRKALLILFILLPAAAIAQSTFSFILVNQKTGEPLPSVWATILMDGNTYIESKSTNSAGICSFSIRHYDSLATYQVEFTNNLNRHIKPGVYDISAIKYSQPIIKVKVLDIPMPYGCGEVLYPGYHPKEAISFDELPVNIQRKVKQYLVDRVGQRFYPKLILNGGQLINLKRFHELAPSYKTEPPAYSLCYMIWNPTTSVNLYCFSLKLDENGKLLNKVLLPDIKHNPAKGKIMTAEEAKEIAVQNNFLVDNLTNANSYYYTEADCIVWDLTNTEPGEGKKKSVKLLIDAHNGKIVDRITSDVYVQY